MAARWLAGCIEKSARPNAHHALKAGSSVSVPKSRGHREAIQLRSMVSSAIIVLGARQDGRVAANREDDRDQQDADR